jgi:hypothetical protein
MADHYSVWYRYRLKKTDQKSRWMTTYSPTAFLFISYVYKEQHGAVREQHFHGCTAARRSRRWRDHDPKTASQARARLFERACIQESKPRMEHQHSKKLGPLARTRTANVCFCNIEKSKASMWRDTNEEENIQIMKHIESLKRGRLGYDTNSATATQISCFRISIHVHDISPKRISTR